MCCRSEDFARGLGEVVAARKAHFSLDKEAEADTPKSRFLDCLDLTVADSEAEVPPRFEVNFGGIRSFFQTSLNERF